MAIDPSTLSDYNGQVDPPSAAYPYGNAKDDGVPGDFTGTPRVAAEVKDLEGFQQALLAAASITPSGTPDTALVSQYLDAIRKITGKLTDGKKYQFLAAAIRNTGAGWAFINDATHEPIGFTGISTLVTGEVQLDHAVGASEVGSMLVVPDETFAKVGILAGGSIGLASSLVDMSAPLEFSVDTVSGAVIAPAHFGTKISAVIGSGTCDVTHPAVVVGGIPVASKIGTGDFDSSDLRMGYGATAVTMRGAGPVIGRIRYDGATWAYIGPLTTPPTVSWSAGVLTVTHPTSDLFNMLVSERRTAHRATGAVINSTSFEARFFDSADALVVTESTSMDFYFSRGGCAQRTDLRGLFSIRRGYAPIDANDLVSGSGNFWILGVLEVA